MEYRNSVLTYLFVLLVVWVGSAQVVLADTPPALPETRPWNDTNAGVHWFRSETLEDIENAFNAARKWENSALADDPAATYLPIAEMDLTSVFTLDQWYALSLEERAIWLINDARTARGLPPYEGTDPFLSEVSEEYAGYMLDNDVSGHTADGRTALERALAHPEIDANCPTLIQESIAYTGGTDERTAYFPIAIAVYNWIYVGTYGHRTSVLYHGEHYNDDTGALGKEGLFGIGMVEGAGYGAFNGIFDDNVQVVVYVHYDPSAECANVPPVSPKENTLLLNEVDYLADGGTFVELYNEGTTALSLRAYTLVVDGDVWQLPAEAVPAGKHVAICSDPALVDNCEYQLEQAITWSDGDSLVLTLAGEAVDTVTLANDNADSPNLAMSRDADTAIWSARCITPGVTNTFRDDTVSLCGQPFGTISQEAIVLYDGDTATIDYIITMVANAQTQSDSQFIPTNTPYENYMCDTSIETELLEPGILQGTWMCTATISLAHEQCTPELAHEVAIEVAGLTNPITHTETVAVACEEAPQEARIALKQTAENLPLGLDVMDRVILRYTIEAANTGTIAAALSLATTPDTAFIEYSCAEALIQTVEPGAVAAWTCTAELSTLYGACAPEVAHTATISGDLLAEEMTTVQTTAVDCDEYPRFTTLAIQQYALIAEQDGETLLLNYTVSVTNNGERPATLEIETISDTFLSSYSCNNAPDTPLAPGESTTFVCSATAPIISSACTGSVAHDVTIQSDDLETSVNDSLTNDINCIAEIPLQVSTSYIGTQTAQPITWLLLALFGLVAATGFAVKR